MTISISIFGTSNAILKGGYVSGIKSCVEVEAVYNFSLGASSTVLLPKIASTENILPTDFAIFDFAINEIAAINLNYSASSQIQARVVEFVATSLHPKTVPVMVIMPSDKAYQQDGAQARIFRNMSARYGWPCFDGYQFIEKEFGSDVYQTGFRDPRHLAPPLAYSFGKRIAEHLSRFQSKIVRRETVDVKSTRYLHFNDVVDSDTPVVHRKNSLLEQTFAVLSGRQPIYFQTPQSDVVGVELNLGQSIGFLEVTSGCDRSGIDVTTPSYKGDGVSLVCAVVPIHPTAGEYFKCSVSYTSSKNTLPRVEIAAVVIAGEMKRVEVPIVASVTNDTLMPSTGVSNRSAEADIQDATLSVNGTQKTIINLIAEGRGEEAEKLLILAERCFGPNPWIIFERARLACNDKLWGELELFSIATMRISPEQSTGYIYGLRAARELKKTSLWMSIVATVRHRFGVAPWLLSEQILYASANSHWGDVLKIAEELREIDTKSELGYHFAFLALRKLNRSSEIAQITERVPLSMRRKPWFTCQAIIEAAEKGDDADVIKLSESLRLTAPTNRLGYDYALRILIEKRLFADAEALLELATNVVPNVDWLCLERLRLADAKKDWRQAVHYAQALRAKLPSHQFGYVAGARALSNLECYDDLRSVLDAAAENLGEATWAMHYRLRLAASNSNWPEILLFATKLRRAQPSSSAGFEYSVRALRELHRPSEAAEVLAEATTSFGDAPWIAVERLLAAAGESEWFNAATWAAVVRERMPERQIGYRIGLQALESLGRIDEMRDIVEVAASRFPQEPWVARARASG